jgi:hypothetical protein
MRFPTLLLAAMIAAAHALPLPPPPIEPCRDDIVMEAFISDNEIDGGSGVFNVILAHRPTREPEEELDPDVDELADIETLHSGQRGWGYSPSREGTHPMQ